MRLSLAAIGIAMDLVGAALIAWGAFGARRYNDGSLIFHGRPIAERAGWLLLIAGFALQLVGEITP